MKKAATKSIFVILLALVMIFPAGLIAYADEGTPPTETTQEVETVPPSEPEQPEVVDNSGTDINAELPPTDNVIPENGEISENGTLDVSSLESATIQASDLDMSESATLSAIVETIAENSAVIVNEVGEPLPLTSQETADVLLSSDPWFNAGGGVVVGYSPTGTCAAVVTECHANIANSIQAALDDIRSTGTVINIEDGDYSSLDVSVNKVVTFRTTADLVINSINLLAGEDISLDPASMSFTALNVFVNAGASIQDGVDLVDAGGIVTVRAGTYAGQIVIEGKDLTLQGEGTVTIEATPNMPTTHFVAVDNIHHPIIMVRNSNNVTLSNLIIDGNGLGGTNYKFYGVEYINSSGTIQNSTVMGIRDNPFSGNQHGLGIQFYNTDGLYREAVVDNVIVRDFNKNGINMTGFNLFGTVRNSQVIGQGIQGLNAQNGIQFWDSYGVIENNTISGFQFRNPLNDWNEGATGILVYYPGGPMEIRNNTVSNTDTALYLYEGDEELSPNTLIQGNTFTNNLVGTVVYNYSNITGTGNTITNNRDYGIQSFQSRAFENFNLVFNNNDIYGNGLGIVSSGDFEWDWEDQESNPQDIIDARNNFWGASTGPSSLVETLYENNNGLGTPAGSGDTVTDFVDYGSFLTQSIFATNPPVDPGDDPDEDPTIPGDGLPGTPIGGNPIIPVTGGQKVGLNCGISSNLTLPSGDSVILNNIDCTFLASILPVDATGLPVQPGESLKFISALTFGLEKDGEIIPSIPANGLVTVSFVLPEGIKDQSFEIYVWDASGAGAWVKLTASIVEIDGVKTVQANVPEGYALPATFMLISK